MRTKHRLKGDRSLFLRFDEVEYAWRIVAPIRQTWAIERDYIVIYPAGFWGLKTAAAYSTKKANLGAVH